MKKLLSAAIFAALFCVIISIAASSSALTAEAQVSDEPAPRLLGDANSDGSVNILDVTAMQKLLCGKRSAADIDLLAADVDENRRVEIFDVTCIQRRLADLDAAGNIGADMSARLRTGKPVSGETGAKTATFYWSPPEVEADGYAVFQAEAGSDDYRRIGTASEPAFTAGGLAPNTKYSFAVCAFREINGEEALSGSFQTLSVTTMAPCVKDLSATFSGDKVFLLWRLSAGADGYEVYMDAEGGPVLLGRTTERWFRQKGLDYASPYTFIVRTYKEIDGKTVVSSEKAEVSGRTLPVAPIYTVKKKGDVFTLSWSKVNGANKYEVWTQLPGSNIWIMEATTSKLTCSLTKKGVSELYFAVRAVTVIDGKSYRGDYRKQRYTKKAAVGSIQTFGDSIARGLGSHYYSYTELIGEAHDLSVENRAVSGAVFCRADGMRSICDEIIKHVKPENEHDAIILEGGYNDYVFDCPLGKVTRAGTTSFDASTVCGAIETALVHIKKNAPDAKLVNVLVHDITDTATRANGTGKTFAEYEAAIKKVCAKYGVTVANCGAQLKTSDQELSIEYTSTRFGVYPNGDGLHPNEKGYKRFYVPMIEAALFP